MDSRLTVISMIDLDPSNAGLPYERRYFLVACGNASTQDPSLILMTKPIRPTVATRSDKCNNIIIL
jgi:hypothetical protein